MQVEITPFEWVAQHLQIIGWPSLCYAVWKVTRFMTNVENRVLGSEAHIAKMATNCFPTMQDSLKNQDSLLKSVDSSLKTQTTALTNMDASLETLVDVLPRKITGKATPRAKRTSKK